MNVSSLTTLLEAIRQHNGDIGLLDRTNIAPTSMMHSGITQAREFDDPPGLHEKTEFLLREWVSLYHQPTAGRDSTKAFSSFVAQVDEDKWLYVIFIKLMELPTFKKRLSLNQDARIFDEAIDVACGLYLQK